jgi:azurin
MTLLGCGLASSAALVACGGGGGDGGGGQSAQPAAPAAPAAGSGGDVTLEISSIGDDSKFDKEQLEAPAGSKITLVFKNAAKPESNKQFNWVLTRPGTHLRVVNAGASEGEANGYVKPNDENVIAATRLIKGGESDTITFDAPPPGEYTYVSTFPGYYTRMRGVLTIK